MLSLSLGKIRAFNDETIFAHFGGRGVFGLWTAVTLPPSSKNRKASLQCGGLTSHCLDQARSITKRRQAAVLQEDQFAYRARAYCRFSVSRNRAKYESKVTNPVAPWKNALPPVSLLTRFSELCP